MPDEDRTREQLLEEVRCLRQSVTDLEQAETRKRAAAETLGEGVLRFRALIENSPDAVTLLGPDGQIRYANPQSGRILDYSIQEFEGQNVFALLHLEDLPTVRQVFELMLATPREAIPIQLRYRHKDGSWRWIDGKGTNLLDEPSVQAIIWNYRDVTYQVRANEERLRLMRSLAERLKELTALHQTSRLLQDERLTTDELLQAVVDLLPPAFQYPDATAVQLTYNGRHFATPNYTDTPWKIAISFWTRDGRQGTLQVVYREEKPPENEGPFFAEERSLINSVAEMLQARLNRRLAEEALQRSELRLRRAQEIAHLGSYEWKVLPEEASYWSPELFRILDLDPATGPITMQSFIERLIHPEDRSAFLEGLDRSLNDGQPFQQEFRILRPQAGGTSRKGESSQRVRWVRSLAEPLTDPAPKGHNMIARGNAPGVEMSSPRVIGLAGTLLDVTERRQLEQQLLHSQKMEAIGRLAGGVAHDFNNLLTVINGFVDLLAGRWSADEVGREMLTQVRDAGERAASLTRQLLAFSRRTILSPVVLNLNDLVGRMEKMLRRLIPADIDLTVLLDPALGSIKADKSQLEQVVMNLVVNARDAMPAGGKLTIETRNVDLEETSTRADVRTGPYALLSVADTGVGMDEQTRAHIFEPFFTTKELGRGTGLGLAVVFGIIKQSDGHIEVDSVPGQGTTFKFYLPRIGESTPVNDRESQLEELSGGSETLLLVEDEEGVRRLAGTVLRKCGYTVLEAADGLDALAVLARAQRPIDLLVTDVIMPRMNGQQLAQQLLQQHPCLKVLYVSGYTDEALGRGGLLEPGTRYLQKPFTLTALTRKVRETLQGER